MNIVTVTGIVLDIYNYLPLDLATRIVLGDIELFNRQLITRTGSEEYTQTGRDFYEWYAYLSSTIPLPQKDIIQITNHENVIELDTVIEIDTVHTLQIQTQKQNIHRRFLVQRIKFQL